jgi:probable rRNA maturation factor
MSSEGSSLVYRAIPKSLRFAAGDKAKLKTFANELSKRIGGGRPFCCLIADDETLRGLNREFRQKDYPTDVLSFPAISASSELGELAISVERAADQAIQHGHALFDEIRILMLHGVLHLAGMDHESDRGEMARAERKLRFDLGLPSSLIARASR